MRPVSRHSMIRHLCRSTHGAQDRTPRRPYRCRGLYPLLSPLQPSPVCTSARPGYSPLALSHDHPAWSFKEQGAKGRSGITLALMRHRLNILGVTCCPVCVLVPSIPPGSTGRQQRGALKWHCMASRATGASRHKGALFGHCGLHWPKRRNVGIANVGPHRLGLYEP
jgi:hypothetical protein